MYPTQTFHWVFLHYHQDAAWNSWSRTAQVEPEPRFAGFRRNNEKRPKITGAQVKPIVSVKGRPDGCTPVHVRVYTHGIYWKLNGWGFLGMKKPINTHVI